MEHYETTFEYKMSRHNVQIQNITRQHSSTECDRTMFEYRISGTEAALNLNQSIRVNRLSITFGEASTMTLCCRYSLLHITAVREKIFSIHRYLRHCHISGLCSVYQAPSYGPNVTLPIPILPMVIYLSMFFIFELACTACSGDHPKNK